MRSSDPAPEEVVPIPHLVLSGAAGSLRPGESLKFLYADGGRPAEGFVVRHASGFSAYANRCAHISLSLDWDDNQFFTSDRTHLVCATHGALYRPEDGVCVAGPCAGDRLDPLPVEVAGPDLHVLVAPVSDDAAERS